MTETTHLRRLKPVPLKSVTIDDAFWTPKQKVNREVTLAHQYKQCKDTGRFESLEKAASGITGEVVGYFFNDSDVYKWLEAAAHSFATHPDPALDAQVDEVIAIVGAAQGPDGYLNSYFTVANREHRWENLCSLHEMYCGGHLFEAAAAHFEATGKRNLLTIAIKFADHIYDQFGPGKRESYCGHEEVELGLVALHRVTNDKRYLELAKLFIDRRGMRPSPYMKELENPSLFRADTSKWSVLKNGEYDGQYLQDHLPLREQTEVVGHAVRAMYFFAGATDILLHEDDPALLAAMERLWDNLANKRMYLTGGIGPTHQNEGFTEDYDLPNDTAYAETCAAIGLVFWAHRMALLTGNSAYADVMEQTLYNGVLSGVSLDGTKFFYENPLETTGKHHRTGWFVCACCPPNISRLLASLGRYVYAASDDGLWVNLYVGGSASIEIPKARIVGIRQETDYPWSGDVKITVETEGEFGVNLRIPGWCEDATAKVNGRGIDATPRDCGYLHIHRTWSAGDLIELTLPMEVRQIEANPKVRHDVGHVALQRGPIVYCLESMDNPAPVYAIGLPAEEELTAKHDPNLLGGVVVLRGEGLTPDEAEWKGKLYREATHRCKSIRITAIPYYAWDNREPGSMIVWLRKAT